MRVHIVAAVHAGRGEADEAFAVLEEALSSGYRDCGYLETSRPFESIRSNPRFADLLDLCRQ